MNLKQLLKGIAEIDTDIEVGGLCLDSRKLKMGEVFIALNGALQHGMAHAGQAIENGASAIIYDPAGMDNPAQPAFPVPAIAITNLAQQLGELAARFYAHPSRQVDLIGITGTNGKTTCSQLIAQALPDCGIIGTLGWGEPGNLNATLNTTPDALAVQHILRTLVDQGKRAITMEVSSHGLEQGRVNGVDFKGAVFTNLSRDHLDYHGDMQTYLQAKLTLFSNPALRFAVVNLDDEAAPQVLATLPESVARWTFSTSGRHMQGGQCLTADNVRHDHAGISFDVHWGERSARAHTAVVGAFNVQNVMTVLCVLLAMDWPFDKAIAQLAHLKPVIGRMEKFGGQNQPLVIVDYAHTPDALEKILQAARGNGQLWVVFGCGGDRDKGKRPEMGRIAEKHADHVIITDDNPRSEASETIIADILAGCSSDNVSVIGDRNIAITTAIRQAGKNDCVVIAGKGHESYQETNGVKIPFSDQAVAQQALAQWSPESCS